MRIRVPGGHGPAQPFRIGRTVGAVRGGRGMLPQRVTLRVIGDGQLFADGRFVLLGLADGPEPAPVVAPHPRLVALSATAGTAHPDLAGVTEVLVRAWLGPAPHTAPQSAASA